MLDLNLATIISRMITVIIAFTVHELSHAWVAHLYGDDTAAREGRLTLNPNAHIEPMGMILFLLVGFGWAKPTPVNEWTLARRSKYAIPVVSLAGPFSNLLLAAVAAIPFRAGWVQYTGFTSLYIPTLPEFLVEFIVLNITLFLFNLIPISPLDGEKILYSLLPAGPAGVLDRIRPYGSLILLAVILVGQLGNFNLIGAILNPPMAALFRLFTGV